jgi:hypothetical protein
MNQKMNDSTLSRLNVEVKLKGFEAYRSYRNIKLTELKKLKLLM